MSFEQWYNQYILKLPPDKQFTKEDMKKAFEAGINYKIEIARKHNQQYGSN